EDLKQKAKEETEALVRGAQRQIQLETARAVQQIRHEVVDLSLAVASKLIKKNLTQEDNDALIQDSLTQIDASQN
ncbi:MAG TPA: ATP synthase F0 subunit B, partial [Planctomycetes bacterium]|nr:ATP synthase F0 subunit B [Planctomycetota bacterium]